MSGRLDFRLFMNASSFSALAVLDSGALRALDLSYPGIVDHDLDHAVAQGFHLLAHQRKPLGKVVVHRRARFLEFEGRSPPKNGMTSSRPNERRAKGNG